MGQAVSYIEDTKKKIEEMKLRRDRLKKPPNAETSGFEAMNHDSSNLPYLVKTNLSKDGVEILMSSGLNKEGFPLSMVLADLLRRKLNVIDCTSVKGDRNYLHKIHIEVTYNSFYYSIYIEKVSTDEVSSFLLDDFFK